MTIKLATNVKWRIDTCKLIDVFSSLEMMNHKNPLEAPLGEFNLRNRNKSHLFLEGKCQSPGSFSDLVKEMFSHCMELIQGKLLKCPQTKSKFPLFNFLLLLPSRSK
jgi:hypothetical protein